MTSDTSSATSGGSPWSGLTPPTYVPDFGQLLSLLDGPFRDPRGPSSGNWASATDDWIACELRRSGFPADEVWPRPISPRVLPKEVGLLLKKATPQQRVELERLILRTPGVASSDARILGRAYVKQVDVVIAQWSRGPELMVSTKTMMSSFRKNLPNRFEEAYGDAANLRGRYPLASIGFLFAMRASVREEPGTLQRAIDMLRKLRGPDTYDSTGLLLIDYPDDPTPSESVGLADTEVPDDLKAGLFIDRLITRVLEAAPVDMHVLVRENRQHTSLSIDSD